MNKEYANAKTFFDVLMVLKMADQIKVISKIGTTPLTGHLYKNDDKFWNELLGMDKAEAMKFLNPKYCSAKDPYVFYEAGAFDVLCTGRDFLEIFTHMSCSKSMKPRVDDIDIIEYIEDKLGTDEEFLDDLMDALYATFPSSMVEKLLEY